MTGSRLRRAGDEGHLPQLGRPVTCFVQPDMQRLDVCDNGLFRLLEKAASSEWIALLKEQGVDVGKDVTAGAIRVALAKLGETIAAYLSNLFGKLDG